MLASYLYRDIWPLCTYTLVPLDGEQGNFIWAQIGLCGFAAMVLPILEPFPYVPVDPLNPQEDVNPEQTASIASYLYYNYVDHIIIAAHRNSRLPRPVLPPLADVDHAKNLIEEAKTYLGTTNVTLLKGLFMIFRVPIGLQVANTIVESIVAFAAPFGTNRLLNYLETSGEDAIVRPWVWIALIVVAGSFLPTITRHYAYYLSDRTFVGMQAMLTSMILERALKMRLKADVAGADVHTESDGIDPGSDALKEEQKPPSAALAGLLTDLVTSDLDNLQSGNEFVGSLVDSPLKLILGIGFVYFVLDWSAFVGLAVMLVLLPVPVKVASLMSGLQAAKMSAMDRRVDAINETVSVIRMIKLFAFTDAIATEIDQKRAEELKYVWKLKIFQVFNQVLSLIIPLMHFLVSFLCYTLIQKRPLTASIVFSVVKAFSIIQGQIQALVYDTPGLIASYVSLKRIQDFLNTTELIDVHVDGKHATPTDITLGVHSDHVGLGHANFTWSADPSPRFTLRLDQDVVFAPGRINLIVGPTGCGKTAFLLALLGELHFVPTSSRSWMNLPRTGGVAYAAQESWVLNDTIRNNIVFGSYFDEARYKQALKQCALEHDLGLFQAGDETEVGEKGLTLSGGQRARVTLARAICSPAQTILLDDVFAALDVQTARWIVDKCFKGDLVRGRTVILVTHNVALARFLAEMAVVMEDGRIKSYGSPDIVLGNASDLPKELQQEQEQINTAEVKADIGDELKGETPESAGAKLILDEEIEIGRVSWDAWSMYYSAMGGRWPVLFWLAAYGGDTLRQSSTVLGTWWLGVWAQAYVGSPAEDVRVTYYIGVYAGIIALGIVFMAFAELLFATGTLRASQLVHRRLVKSMLSTSFRWLDTTPSSRLVARCTHDIGAVDGGIAQCTQWMIIVSNTMLVYLAAVCLFSPVFIVAGLVLCVGGAALGHFYVKAQVATKREMSISQPPVLAVFGSAVGSLVSVRAYGAERMFRAALWRQMDRRTSAARTFFTLSKWIGTRTQTLGAAFVGALAVYLVYGPRRADPSAVGFSLNVAAGFSSQILWLVTTLNELEVFAISLERIKAYITADQEPEATERGQPPAHWPTSGDLHVENLSARYSEDGSKVLDSISFDVKSGERIGIVGRTGSGKSTLALALLRAVPTEGTIMFGGRDVHALNLAALRQAVTIIPQVPELLSGTLRRNLDVFGAHDAATLNSALRAAGLAGRLALDAPIAAGGASLSVGERQLVALARALVRGSRLLVLDEATSAVDGAADAAVRTALREAVPRDVTVLVVAHRLASVAECDRIMVLDAGRIAEFDTPRALLADEKSAFRRLVEQSTDRDVLLEMVRGGRSVT